MSGPSHWQITGPSSSSMSWCQVFMMSRKPAQGLVNRSVMDTIFGMGSQKYVRISRFSRQDFNSHWELSRAEEVLSRKHEEKKNILSVILTDKQHMWKAVFAHGNFATCPKGRIQYLVGGKFFKKRKTFLSCVGKCRALRIMVHWVGWFIIRVSELGDKTKRNRSGKCLKTTLKNVVDINHLEYRQDRRAASQIPDDCWIWSLFYSRGAHH